MVSVTFDPKLLKNLKGLQKELHEKMKAEVVKTALVDVETPAKQDCRVDTGRLRASIHTKYTDKKTHSYKDDEGESFDGTLKEGIKDTNTIFKVVVGTNVEYASRIEDISAFLEPNYLKAKPKLEERIKKIISDWG
jgi:phage gpG-like protein